MDARLDHAGPLRQPLRAPQAGLNLDSWAAGFQEAARNRKCLPGVAGPTRRMDTIMPNNPTGDKARNASP
jgi:hypothetical protein